jgi:hypothetical protein
MNVKMNRVFFTFWFVLMFYCTQIRSFCQSSTIELSLPAAAGQEISVFGYDGFQTDTLPRIKLDSLGAGKVRMKYRGFILIKLPGGQQYPLIVNNKKTFFGLRNMDVLPEFRDDAENRFLYYYLTIKGRTARQSELLDESLTFITDNDTSRNGLMKEKVMLEEEKKKLVKIFADSSKYLAAVILQAKSLMETTYGINSREELKESKDAFFSFILDHFGELRHTDMLQQMAAQFMMMNEYVKWDHDFPFEKGVISDVGVWIDKIGNRIPPDDIVNYFLRFYLGRSMVSLSGTITFSYNEYLKCPAKKTSQPHAKEINGTFDIRHSSDPKLEISLDKMMGNNKVLFFYKEGCPACIVEQIMLNRRLREQQSTVPYITVFLPGETNKGLAVLTRLQSEQFYYLESDRLYQKAGIDQYPSLVVLSSDNKVIRKYYRLEDMQRYIGTNNLNK